MVKEWSPLQEEIRQLYHEENMSLLEVMRLVKGKYGFHASERAYRIQLRKWGYMKNSTESCPNPRMGGRNSGRVRLANPPPDPAVAPALAGISSPLRSTNVARPSQFDANFNRQDRNGRTQLHLASFQGNVEVVRSLLHSGVAVHIKDAIGNEPLQYAVIAGNVDIVRLLLRFGADANTKGNLGRSPLHQAVPEKELVEILLNNGAEVSSQDDKGDTPLHLAILNPPAYSAESESVIDILVHSGSNLNQASNVGLTPFQMLLGQRLEPIGLSFKYLSLFLDSGASVSHALPIEKSPFEIFLAKFDGWEKSMSGANKVFKKFIEKGSSPHSKLSTGELAVFKFFRGQDFTWTNDTEGAEMLCRSVDFEAVSYSGTTVLHELSTLHNSEYPKTKQTENLIAILLQRGADPNRPNLNGETPVLVFIMQLKRKGTVLGGAISKLIANGADVMRQDDKGNTALYEAARNWPKEFLKSMLKAAIEQRQHVNDFSEPRAELGEPGFLDNLARVFKAEDWTEAKHLLRGFRGSLSDDVETIRLTVFELLVDKHLEMVKGMFRGQETTVPRRRNYVAQILRDCRESKVKLNMEHVDYLLELCK